MADNLYQLLGIAWDAPESIVKAAIEQAENQGSVDPVMLKAARQALLNPVMRQHYNNRLKPDHSAQENNLQETAITFTAQPYHPQQALAGKTDKTQPVEPQPDNPYRVQTRQFSESCSDQTKPISMWKYILYFNLGNILCGIILGIIFNVLNVKSFGIGGLLITFLTASVSGNKYVKDQQQLPSKKEIRTFAAWGCLIQFLLAGLLVIITIVILSAVSIGNSSMTSMMALMLNAIPWGFILFFVLIVLLINIAIARLGFSSGAKQAMKKMEAGR